MSLTQFTKPWFSGTPVNARAASISIGSGTNGKVTITAPLVGTEGNSYSVTVSTSGASGCDMSATISGMDITVVLGKTGTSLEATKNTATLIAAAIDALEGVSAVASGTGADSISTAADKTNFTGGQYATPAKTKSIIVISGTWYIATKPVSKWTTDGWYSASPSLIV